MEKNIFTLLRRTVKTFLVYQPGTKQKRFVLAESPDDTTNNSTLILTKALAEHQALLRYARRLAVQMEKSLHSLKSGIFLFELTETKEAYAALETQQRELTPLLLSYANEETLGQQTISSSLLENRRIIENIYKLPTNQGITIRTFTINVYPETKAMLVFLDGLSDKNIINQMILGPLMSLGGKKKYSKNNSPVMYETNDKNVFADHVISEYLPLCTIVRIFNFTTVQDGINSGNSVIFIEGLAEAILVDTKGIEHRAIERPQMEQTVRGSQEGFTELLDINVSLIRNSLKISDLICEIFPIGTRSRNSCAVMYIKSIANPKLVSEVKRRIQSLHVDYIGDTNILGLYIEDSPTNPFPQSLNTERPDRVAAHLAEGRIAIALGGSPTVLVVPVTIATLMHSPDDYSMPYMYSSMIRLVRVIGGLISLLMPSLYLAISIYHPEAMPTDLLLTIMNARQQVPFPSIVEILLMEFAFELIRESGIRVPGMLGSTIGIVGAIIIGQAAVVAKIVSPIMILIIAVTGLSSYVIPEYRLANAIRFCRFFFLILAASFGLVGVAAGLVSLVATLSSLKSFGVPYLAPLAPRTFYGRDIILRGPMYDQELRPDFLQPLDKQRQPHISRSWIQEPPEGSGNS